jgi:hypothetical protein
LVLAHPDHVVSRSIAELARKLADRPLGDASNAGSRRLGFLRRAAR